MDLNEYTGNLYEQIVSRILEERKSRGISKKQIAQDLGLNPVTYSDMENGKTKFSVVRLIAVLKYLEIEDIFKAELPGEVGDSGPQDLVVVEDFESFLTRFHQQSEHLEELKKENKEIKALLHQIIDKLGSKKDNS